MAKRTASRPNILLIIADQLAWKALGAYGNAFVRTPNLDRLAARGVRFETCYTPCPLCLPARAAFWTGRWPHETGVVSNGRKWPQGDIPPDMPTLGTIFTAGGYECVHFGKTHDGGSLRGFTVEPWEGLPVEPAHPAWPVNYDTRRDRYTMERTVAFLRDRPTGATPWLAVADLCNPHDICNWVGHNTGAHENVPVPGELPPLPENFRDDDFLARPIPVQYICCAHNRQSQAVGWNETNYRHYLAAYYHFVGRLDADAGRILDALDARGDAGDTLVIFTADHGDAMGAHRLVTKHTSLYDETTHVPLIAAGAGVAGRGRAVAGLASLLDLLPTLCDAADIAAPAGLRGRSLLPWIGDAKRSDSPHEAVMSQWHTEWGFTVEPGRMVRTERYKYTRYREGDGEELFDMIADPGETRTLVGDPRHAAALAEHRRRLEAFARETGDPFFHLPWQADARWRSHEPGYDHHTGPAAPMVEG